MSGNGGGHGRGGVGHPSSSGGGRGGGSGGRGGNGGGRGRGGRRGGGGGGMCFQWRDTGVCRLGSNCKFTHLDGGSSNAPSSSFNKSKQSKDDTTRFIRHLSVLPVQASARSCHPCPPVRACGENVGKITNHLWILLPDVSCWRFWPKLLGRPPWILPAFILLKRMWTCS